MCGIAGIIDVNNRVDRDILLRMTNIMQHRGPDGEGFYIDTLVGLGHRRLSIIDLEGGSQPMSNEDGSVWITYNGEIYNFPILQKGLSQRGHRFRTRSDTEVIIHAYEEYGTDCLRHLRGMFAFAIWDAKKSQLFLARDRLGKKPLYYYFNNERFVFTSEIKAILQDQGIPRAIDLTALKDYFTYGYIPFPKTIFKDIYKLPPAHFMVVSLLDARVTTVKPIKQAKLTIKIDQYWDIKYEPDYSLSERQWIEALLEKLKEAVKIRLISDVPLGVFLSGGLDSSTVVALMSMVQDMPVKTFSIGFKEEDFSELRYARTVAERFGTKHHEMIVEPDAIEILPRLAWQFDEPFADSSAIPTYYVSKIARENVTVILSGDGGDETFAGYNRYASAFWFYNYARFIPRSFRRLIFGGISSLMPCGMRGKGFLRHLALNPFEYYKGMISQDDMQYLDKLFSGDIKKEIIKLNQSNEFLYDNGDFLNQFFNRYQDADFLTRIQYLETKTYLPEDILTKVDRASMLCSLETRAPLLDHELLEFVARIPSTYKIRGGEKKYILKKAMSTLLPEEILRRDKMGFCTPLRHWFKKDLTGYAREILLDRRFKERGFFNIKHIESLINNHRLRHRDLSQHIWQLLFFEHWCRNWLD
jgi:asparagine synthase (glutamine-hydrolysing)